LRGASARRVSAHPSGSLAQAADIMQPWRSAPLAQRNTGQPAAPLRPLRAHAAAACQLGAAGRGGGGGRGAARRRSHDIVLCFATPGRRCQPKPALRDGAPCAQPCDAPRARAQLPGVARASRLAPACAACSACAASRAGQVCEKCRLGTNRSRRLASRSDGRGHPSPARRPPRAPRSSPRCTTRRGSVSTPGREPSKTPENEQRQRRTSARTPAGGAAPPRAPWRWPRERREPAFS
jgi:hypothetical protein